MSSHKKPPKWYGQGYGDLAGWDRAVNQCRALLVERARLGITATYSEVAQTADAIPWPEGAHTHEGRQIGYLLGEVSVGEWLQDRPLLSAIVVYADRPVPGEGFHNLAEELGFLPVRNKETEEVFWGQEREKCFRCWGIGGDCRE